MKSLSLIPVSVLVFYKIKQNYANIIKENQIVILQIKRLFFSFLWSMFLWKLNLKILARYKRSKWVRSLCGFAATRWFSVFKCHIGYSLVLFFFFLTGEIPLQNKKIKNKKGSHMRQNVSCRYKAKRSQAAQCVPQPKGPGPVPLSPCAFPAHCRRQHQEREALWAWRASWGWEWAQAAWNCPME